VRGRFSGTSPFFMLGMLKKASSGVLAFCCATYGEYAPRANRAVALLDELPAFARTCFLNIPTQIIIVLLIVFL